ncbi:MAG TPA: hypothetical protein VK467_10325 [Gemmatimonadales bacterium]|nr:hypothetical protein [Gemmatimonadales bacterium]
MTIRIAESWDGYGGQQAAASGRWGAPIFSSTHARTGTWALGGTGASGVAVSCGIGNLVANLTFHFGVWVYWTGTIPAQTGIVFGLVETSPYNGFNAQCGVSANTAHQLRFDRGFNGGVTLETSDPCLNTNAWNYITGTILVANAGTWDIYCNGVQVLNGSGDTQANTAQVGGIHLGTGATYWVDSVWMMDPTGSFNNAHPGLTSTFIVSAFLPTGAGATTGLTPSAGSNFQNVDEAPPDSDTTYNSGASNAYDTYAMSWSSLTGYGILGMIVSTWNRSISGAQNCNAVLRVGGVDNHGATKTPPTTYRYDAETSNNNPTSGLAWDYTALSTTELGWRAGGTTLRLSQLYADVISTGSAFASPVAYLVFP